jgi:rRNA maturation endonuclease Nob1
MELESQNNKTLVQVEDKSEKMQNYVPITTIKEKSKYCYNCGTELDERERKFCPFCGVNVL